MQTSYNVYEVIILRRNNRKKTTVIYFVPENTDKSKKESNKSLWSLLTAGGLAILWALFSRYFIDNFNTGYLYHFGIQSTFKNVDVLQSSFFVTYCFISAILSITVFVMYLSNYFLGWLASRNKAFRIKLWHFILSISIYFIILYAALFFFLLYILAMKNAFNFENLIYTLKFIFQNISNNMKLDFSFIFIAAYVFSFIKLEHWLKKNKNKRIENDNSIVYFIIIICIFIGIGLMGKIFQTLGEFYAMNRTAYSCILDKKNEYIIAYVGDKALILMENEKNVVYKLIEPTNISYTDCSIPSQ